MAATFEISVPDTLIKALGADPTTLPRQAFEAFVAQSYRAGKISHAQVAEILSLDRWQTDSFLKGAQANRPWETAEFSADLENLRSQSK
jgi:hypothetical protein